MSRICIIYPESSTPQTGMGGRHHYFAKELVKLGHDVTVVAARRHHLLRDGIDTDALPPEEMVEGYRFVRVNMLTRMTNAGFWRGLPLPQSYPPYVRGWGLRRTWCSIPRRNYLVI